MKQWEVLVPEPSIVVSNISTVLAGWDGDIKVVVEVLAVGAKIAHCCWELEGRNTILCVRDQLNRCLEQSI